MNHSYSRVIDPTTMSDSARMWGALWGDRPHAWAVTEEQQAPVYAAALHHAPVRPGDRVLDVGCATGVFLRMCADRGATVSGLDASGALLALARERVPEADLRVGDLQVLPYADATFDAVTGFTSFFFADDIVAALREAGRVARPGAPVVIQVFGRPELCDLEALKAAVMRFRDHAEDEYWRPGIVEELVPQAGLTVEQAFDVTTHYRYDGDDALAEAMMAAGGAALVAGPEREGELRAAILDALAHCRQPGGGYRLSNEWHVVVARA
jgi:ubiquinone/menaquinone biosynthesis C-methylase UbiE